VAEGPNSAGSGSSAPYTVSREDVRSVCTAYLVAPEGVDEQAHVRTDGSRPPITSRGPDGPHGPDADASGSAVRAEAGART
jgi:hypothetical protein